MTTAKTKHDSTIITFSSVSIFGRLRRRLGPFQWIWVIGTAMTTVRTTIAAKSLRGLPWARSAILLPGPATAAARTVRRHVWHGSYSPRRGQDRGRRPPSSTVAPPSRRSWAPAFAESSGGKASQPVDARGEWRRPRVAERRTRPAQAPREQLRSQRLARPLPCRSDSPTPAAPPRQRPRRPPSRTTPGRCSGRPVRRRRAPARPTSSCSRRPAKETLPAAPPGGSPRSRRADRPGRTEACAAVPAPRPRGPGPRRRSRATVREVAVSRAPPQRSRAPPSYSPKPTTSRRAPGFAVTTTAARRRGAGRRPSRRSACRRRRRAGRRRRRNRSTAPAASSGSRSQLESRPGAARRSAASAASLASALGAEPKRREQRRVHPGRPQARLRRQVGIVEGRAQARRGVPGADQDPGRRVHPLAGVRKEALGVRLHRVLERRAVDLGREAQARAGEDRRAHDQVVGERGVHATRALAATSRTAATLAPR